MFHQRDEESKYNAYRPASGSITMAFHTQLEQHMTILVTGATGTVGRHVVDHLVARGADVRALVRDPAKAGLPAAVTTVQGDLTDIDALRAALAGASTLFLLNAVVPDEFTQALTALNLAREAGIERVVYLSVIHSDQYVNVPHFAGKFGVERMLEQMGFSATILRPAYFIDNDRAITDVIDGYGIYPMPIGNLGLAMIDAYDIGEIAAIALLERDQAPASAPLVRFNLVGPQTLTGPQVAAIWSDVLGRPVVHGGNDPAAFEHALRNTMPHWMAYDMRLMSERFQDIGMLPMPGDVERLTALLGRPLRRYRNFARAIVAAR